MTVYRVFYQGTGHGNIHGVLTRRTGHDSIEGV